MRFKLPTTLLELSNSPLGVVSMHFESGHDDNIISSSKGDPGGKSYGLFQMAINTGTLQRFVDWYNATDDSFIGMEVGSKEFDKAWIEESEDEGFVPAQMRFILEGHYQRLINRIRDDGISHAFFPLLKYRAMKELLVSLAVQHGGAINILRMAYQAIKPTDSIDTVITFIMMARKDYVKELRSVPVQTRNNIIKNRYPKELEALKTIIKLEKS